MCPTNARKAVIAAKAWITRRLGRRVPHRCPTDAFAQPIWTTLGLPKEWDEMTEDERASFATWTAPVKWMTLAEIEDRYGYRDDA